MLTVSFQAYRAAVADPVWALLAAAYRHLGVRPTLLERDFHFPPLPVLLAEVDSVRALQAAAPEEAPAHAV